MPVKRNYSWVFANSETHESITRVSDVETWGSNLGFYLDGTAIGRGALEPEGKNRKRKYVHTTSTRIFDRFRKRGHGIELYRALIETARSIGAKRIYSDHHLNKLSRRMWKTKLARLGYKVKVVPSTACAKPCRHCRRNERYFIVL